MIKSQSSPQLEPNTCLLDCAEQLYSRAYRWIHYFPQAVHSVSDVELDLKNQRVIKFDVLRTRAALFDASLRVFLEKLLTYFSKQSNITYKQGLNELAAPFIILTKAGLELEQIYCIFEGFVRTYMTHFFDDEYVGIRTIYRSFEMLLRYHDPELALFLESQDFIPEFYATPWFITMFVSKSSLRVAQCIIEAVMELKDKFFIFSFCIAALIKNREAILQQNQAHLPLLISRIEIQTLEEFGQIFKLAVKVHQATPQSFHLGLLESNLFELQRPPRILEFESRLIKMSSKEVIAITRQQLLEPRLRCEHAHYGELIKQARVMPCLPVLVVNELSEETYSKMGESNLIVIDIKSVDEGRMLERVENFKLTNQVQVILCLKDRVQIERISEKLRHTRFVCLGDL